MHCIENSIYDWLVFFAGGKSANSKPKLEDSGYNDARSFFP